MTAKWPDQRLSTPERIEFGNKPHRYDPVGACIYCGATETKLGEEHIIPYGLAGNSLILPEASCRNCEKITGKIELQVLRKNFGSLRSRLSAPTRNKKDRKPTLTLNRAKFQTMLPGEKAIALEPLELPVEQFPQAFIGLHLGLPGLLLGTPVDAPLNWDFFHIYNKDEAQPFLKEKGDTVRLGEINPYVFAQFLAKVAHAYATAFRGYGSFTPLLTDLIFGKTEFFRGLVGGLLEIEPPSPDEIHRISCKEMKVGNINYVVVPIRLFSFLATPTYLVVAGKIETNAPQP